MNLEQSEDTLPALPDSEDEDTVEVSVEPEERPRLTRSLSDRGPNSVLEPLSIVRAASMPVVAEQVEVFEDRARGLLPDSQTATEAEAMLRSPPPLRRSAQGFPPYKALQSLLELYLRRTLLHPVFSL